MVKPASSVAAKLGLGIVAPALALLLQSFLWPHIPPSPHLLFFPAVFTAAWLGGFGAGTLATMLSAAFIAFQFLPPLRSLQIASQKDALDLAIFTVVSLAMTYVIGRANASSEAARLAARDADAASRMKDEFLATASHEPRTPLNAIIGWAHMLRGDLLSNPAMVERGLDVIRRNARAEAKLVEDILDMSRIITGKLRIDTKPTDLASLAREAIDTVRPSAEAKGLTLDFEDLDRPALLLGDPERLQQVLCNLLSNAVKFTDAGTIRVRVRPSDGEITLCVDDTGRGIDHEILPFIFERFRQGDSSTTRAFGGLGLGLAIVRHIVELHGGRVIASSGGRDRGSSFCVTLPARAVGLAESPRAIAPPSTDALFSPASLSGTRVLVIDDDPDALVLLQSSLVARGAVVQTASSAATALRTLAVFQPQVIVSDIGMPHDDGYALIRKVRTLQREAEARTPAIALTAYAGKEDAARALVAGFDRHVTKPVDLDVFIALVGNLARGDFAAR